MSESLEWYVCRGCMLMVLPGVGVQETPGGVMCSGCYVGSLFVSELVEWKKAQGIESGRPILRMDPA